ncbi:hypothetical protein [Leifsonia sp. Leaf264]|uniref:hypothetical protein n=1 Tax=Leifsonia sp. Leaf264 TaxID=1736314 RepID=UPI000700B05F|nr:hypothetical protein [Leifsonia sp. Leaf264]KQO99625.1 hypothetical protein ASF30_06845 [Leifsonia sp. Leaf264]
MVTSRSAAPRAGAPVSRGHVWQQSPWPLIVALASTGISVVLIIVELVIARQQQVVSWLVLPIVPPDAVALPILGYLFTPVLVVIALGWNRVSERNGLRDRYFVAVPRYASALRWLAGASVVLGIWHVVNIAYIVDVALSDSWGLS